MVNRIVLALGILIFISYLSFVVDFLRTMDAFNHTLVEYIQHSTR